MGLSSARLGKGIHLGSHWCFCQLASNLLLLPCACQPPELFFETLQYSLLSTDLGFQLSPPPWLLLVCDLLSSLEFFMSFACWHHFSHSFSPYKLILFLFFYSHCLCGFRSFDAIIFHLPWLGLSFEWFPRLWKCVIVVSIYQAPGM